MPDQKVKMWMLRQRQGLPLDVKVSMSKSRIRSFYDHVSDGVYVAFSGGKDSTVLLHLVRQVYPKTPAVFIDTGLEYPEIREFVRQTDNVIWLKPKMSFYQVIKKYGYPVVSKEQAHFIYQYRNTRSAKLKHRVWFGKEGRYKISNKWKFLVDAPFKISEQCCYVLKKNPVKKYEKQTKQKPYLGIMAADSNVRERLYLRNGCNILVEGKERSQPISFWVEKDIWDYIKKHKVPYCKIYDRGVPRTGCIFCLFGIHYDPDRFETLKALHPKLYNYCMDKLDIKTVLDYINNPQPPPPYKPIL